MTVYNAQIQAAKASTKHTKVGGAQNYTVLSIVDRIHEGNAQDQAVVKILQMIQDTNRQMDYAKSLL